MGVLIESRRVMQLTYLCRPVTVYEGVESMMNLSMCIEVLIQVVTILLLMLNMMQYA